MNNQSKYILTFFVVLLCIFFLWFCPPLKGKYYFNILLLISSIILFLYGLIFGDFTLSGLIITTANGLTRLSPNLYPTVSFLCCCLFVGYLLSRKEKNKQIFIENNKAGVVVSVVLSFWIINVVSGIVHIIILSKPGIVFIVNRAMMTNLEIIYHIVGYVLFPLSCGVIFFLLVLNFIDENKEKNFFIFSSVGIIISSIIGILQATGVLKGIFGYIISWEPRVNGLFSDFNSFSISLALLLPIFCYYLFNSKSIFFKSLFFVSIVLGCINLFLTGTRSGLLLVGIFCILYMIILLFKGRYKIFLFVGCLVILLIGGFKMLNKTNIVRKFYGINRIFTALTSNIFQQIQQRKLFWNTGLKVWRKNIWFGSGIKSVYKEFANINPLSSSDNACSSYINSLAEVGVIGCLFLLLILLLTVWSLFIKLKFSKSSLIIAVVLISFFVSIFFGHHLEAEEVVLLVSFYLGINFKNSKKIIDSFFRILKTFIPAVVVIYSLGSIAKLYTDKVDIFAYANFAGFYPQESIAEKHFRWSDKIAYIKLVNQQGRKLIVEFNSFGYKNQTVKVFIDNKLDCLIQLKNNEWYKREIQIIQPLSLLKILPQKNFTPAGKILRYIFPFIGRDYRRLGITVIWYIV